MLAQTISGLRCFGYYRNDLNALGYKGLTLTKIPEKFDTSTI
jgi:hypothetical protein